MEWWRDARFGMFIHWGLYSIQGGEWKGKDYGKEQGGASAEWVMNSAKIPGKEYRETLTPKFNPTDFDAKEWVSIAKQAGMKYAVLTAKHHSGHCLWDSSGYEYDVASSGTRTDVVAEFMAACQAEGLKAGIYFAIPDGHNEGGAVQFKGPPVSDEYFRLIKMQIGELHTSYPGIYEQWLDGTGRLSSQQRSELFELIKRVNPDCLVAAMGSPPNDVVVRQSSWPCDILTSGRPAEGVALHDPVKRVGGLLHFMLPDSSIDKAKAGKNPHMFADTGLVSLIKQMQGLGGSPRQRSGVSA